MKLDINEITFTVLLSIFISFSHFRLNVKYLKLDLCIYNGVKILKKSYMSSKIFESLEISKFM